jgi:hypothetical protein
MALLAFVQARLAKLSELSRFQPIVCYLESVWVRCPVFWEATWRSPWLGERWPVLAREPTALAWLAIRSDLGLAPRTLDAYSRGLSEYLVFCAAASTDPLTAGRDHIARYVRELTQRPPRRAGANTAPSSDASLRLANATVQHRLTAVRLFYDHLVEEGVRDMNPVGRGRYAPGPHGRQPPRLGSASGTAALDSG